MTHQRKIQFWLDNTAGTLTEASADLNQVDLERTVDILENTGLNDDHKVKSSGIMDTGIPLNGFYNDATTSIWHWIDQAQATSVTKTWQIKVGARYWNGECLPGGLKISGDGQKKAMASSKLEVTAEPNSTSVALA